MNMNDMNLTPVGVVRSVIEKPCLVARAGDLHWDDDDGPRSHDASETVSEILIHPEYMNLLDGIEDFSHALILYWAHRVDAAGRALTRVHPLGRKDLPLVGVFATCSPARPNPILAIAVKILERKGSGLLVAGLDAVDGSPVLDIKPYLPHYYAVLGARLSTWMNRIIDDLKEAEQAAVHSFSGRERSAGSNRDRIKS
ncbi:MAG: tRNA (N6-threonylcarbamoyladenosine(37)-N6)-methyltransferase TrmO [Deltaproteobacteria bacterium]|nr:tRNA (N6-threonylcarbamoyladenosine(37)-N6)-methyltransferase TrmO [Candidatus Anaeroferrophillacea bacterium]